MVIEKQNKTKQKQQQNNKQKTKQNKKTKTKQNKQTKNHDRPNHNWGRRIKVPHNMPDWGPCALGEGKLGNVGMGIMWAIPYGQ